MHWVDMQWLWGYDVLPGSVRDMLHLCRETGIKGNVNFDAIGYEKMAAECPEALAELREAIAHGVIEPVGCSYGQPYGLFNGCESNIRQLTYGVRSTRRLLGVRPLAFWEEEFYFFPQLPQMLRQCGYTGACLFFQWTWHTPEVPREPHALILWEGIDGSQLPALPRNELNLHQWPEDFAPLFESKLLRDLDQPTIVQWVELMPSKDWMCRSEVLLPKLKELIANPEFKIVPGTLSEVIAKIGSGAAPVRNYSMDDVWHGMTLGKNDDAHPRRSALIERELLWAESITAVASLLGRPYPQWDVYPTWELDEAWRELLAAQHHDNHECEGLCGSIGRVSFSRAMILASDIVKRASWHIASRLDADDADNAAGAVDAVFNDCGWVSGATLNRNWESVPQPMTVEAPPFGFVRHSRQIENDRASIPPLTITQRDDLWTLRRGDSSLEIDPRTGFVHQFRVPGLADLIFDPVKPLGLVATRFEGRKLYLSSAIVSCDVRNGNECSGVSVALTDEFGFFNAVLDYNISSNGRAIEIRFWTPCDSTAAWVIRDPGLTGSLRLWIRPVFEFRSLIADSPCSAAPIETGSSGVRKYPEGDWMTSPQWFESIEHAFTGLNFVDLVGVRMSKEPYGLLIAHNGSQQFFRMEDGVECVLNTKDPWDGEAQPADSTVPPFECRLALIPHRNITDAERIRLTREAIRPSRSAQKDSCSPVVGDIPPVFGPLSVEGAPGVLATAFFRESSKSGEHLPDWAGHEMARRSDGICTHPFVIRLVEYNGEPAEVTLKLVGPVASAAKTNLMGEVGEHVAAGEDTRWLDVTPAEPPEWAIDPNTGACYEFRGLPLEWSQVTFRVRPREIASVYADMVMGRKEYRDLDAKRKVWATVHRTKGETAGD